MRARIDIDEPRLAEICRRYGIKRLAFFGSVLQPTFSDDSDVDILVEFQPGRTPGLGFFALEAELSELLGRRVDLNTPGFLSPRFRERVIEEAYVDSDQRSRSMRSGGVMG